MRLKTKNFGLVLSIIIFITQFSLFLNFYSSVFYPNFSPDLNQKIFPKNSLTAGSNFFTSEGIGQDVSLSCMINKNFINNNTQEEGIEIVNEVNGWNMTEFELNFTNITVEDVKVQFESRNDGTEAYAQANYFYAVSFVIPNTCFIRNASMFIQYWGSGSGFDDSEFSIRIYNATTILNEIYPHKALDNSSDETLFVLTGQPVNQPARWYQANYTDRILNISNTINNTFFIVFQSVKYPNLLGLKAETFFYYADEKPNDNYNIKLYKKTSLSNPWEELKGKNGLFRVGFTPISYNPSPEQINLTVFSSQVDDSGQYLNFDFQEHQDNKYLIPIASSWFGEVQYNVTFEGKFNYLTKTSTTFKAEVNRDVIWNSTILIDKFPNNCYNQASSINNPQYWLYNNTIKGTLEFDNVTNFGSYIEILNCSNDLWIIKYSQITSILDISIESGPDMAHWMEVETNINSTDYVNITANFYNENGITLLYVTTTKLDITIDQNIENLTHQFPLWRPDLNTSIISDGEPLEIKIMTHNGTMAGIYVQNFSINLIREAVSLEFFRDLSNRYVWGTSLAIDIKLTSQGNAIEGAFIQFLISEAYSNGITIEKILNDTTDDDGIAGVSFIIGELDSIEVNISFSGNVHYEDALISKHHIDIVSPIEQFFLDFIILIIGATLILIGSVSYSIIKRTKRRKNMKLWNKKTQLFSNVLNIEYLLILHKVSGLPLIKKEFGKSVFDATLIGGFLQAITSFKYEIRKKDVEGGSKESMLLDYQDYKISIQDGDFIRLALILSSEASESLKLAQKNFILEFEKQFRNLLIDFEGELDPFLKDIPLIDEIFQFSLVNPHIVNKNPPIIKLKSFQERILSVARLLESDSKYFFISNLVNYIISAMPKEPRDKIIANIYDLREQQLILPIDFN